MTSQGSDGVKIVLTKPLSLDGDAEADYRAPNLIRRILSLFKNIRPGSNVTNLQLPPIFNSPKSQLQCFGEPVYCFGKNLLHECNNAESPLERFTSVVAWSISTTRPPPFGVAPYNPILGETHHVSRGSLNVLLEQVSHHPPAFALHATDEEENIEFIWCQGTKVEVEMVGKRQLRLLNHGETYTMNSPNFLFRFIPPGVDWIGNVKICCQETGLEAELIYTNSSFLGRKGKHFVKGKIYQSVSMKTLYEVEGYYWNSTVKVKDINSGKDTILYDAKEVFSGLKTPIFKDLQGVWPSESVVVWSEVSKGILSKDWVMAKQAKNIVEENQRKLVKEKNSKGETWIPKHFTVSYSKETGWDCSPIEDRVPPAPIVVPF